MKALTFAMAAALITPGCAASSSVPAGSVPAGAAASVWMDTELRAPSSGAYENWADPLEIALDAVPTAAAPPTSEQPPQASRAPVIHDHIVAP
jgi:hypothetical protein